MANLSKRPEKRELRSPQDKDARALVFMLERIGGKSISQIAINYNCSRATVDNYLAYGRKQGLVVNEARQLIADKLLPMALAVYEAQLESGNLEAAQDLLFGTGVLQKTSNVQHKAEASDTLETFRDAYFKVTDAELAPNVPNTSPVRALHKALPEAPSSNEPIDDSQRRLPHLLDQADEDSAE